MQLDAIKSPRSLPVDLSAALDASGVVGAWSWSACSDFCTLDAGAATVLAGDSSLAGRPVPLETAKACVHPDDRPALFSRFRALRERGGLFVAEYRTISPSGRVRRILDRGRVTGGVSTRRHGHGIIIDVTEGVSRPDCEIARVIDPADALTAAVDHAIDCRDALDSVNDPELRLLVDMLLLSLGRKIARTSMGMGSRRGH